MPEKRIIDIEELVKWTYHRQRADVVRQHTKGGWNQGGGTLAFEHIAELGVRCDFFGVTCQIHPDAEVVDDAVMAMSPSEQALLIHYGKSTDRPDWMPGAEGKIEPLLNGRGKVSMIYDRNNNPIACRVRNVVWSEVIKHRRMQYAVWWQALYYLAGRLMAEPERLTQHQVMPPSAPHSPWDDETA